MRPVYMCIGLLLTLALAAQGCCPHCKPGRLDAVAVAGQPDSQPVAAQP